MASSLYSFSEHAVDAVGDAFEQAGSTRARGTSAARVTRFVVGLNARDARVAWHVGILPVARRWGAVGVTLGPFVYLREDKHLHSWPLLVHETTHVAQFIERGQPAFLLRYGLHYLRGRARGLPDRAAYEEIVDEAEARAVESVARQSASPRSPYLVPA